MDANSIKPTRYLKDHEAAKVLGLCVGHLRNLRCKGKGPPVTRFGRACRYNWRTLLAWAEGQKVETKKQSQGRTPRLQKAQKVEPKT